MRTSLWNCKAGHTVQVRKETLGSTYNRLQVCGHWYSAVASTESSVCIGDGRNSCRLMHRNGRKSWRWLHQRGGALSHGRLGLCAMTLRASVPSVKPWGRVRPLSSERRRSRILNPRCGWTVERGQKALQKLNESFAELQGATAWTPGFSR